MRNICVKLLPILFFMFLGKLAYVKIDSKYNITKKISLLIPLRPKWKAAAVVSSTIVATVIIGGIGIYVIDIDDTLYFAIIGILSGISIDLSEKLSKR